VSALTVKTSAPYTSHHFFPKLPTTISLRIVDPPIRGIQNGQNARCFLTFFHFRASRQQRALPARSRREPNEHELPIERLDRFASLQAQHTRVTLGLCDRR